MENNRGFKRSQYACAVLLIVSSIGLVTYQVVKIDDVAAEGGFMMRGHRGACHFCPIQYNKESPSYKKDKSHTRGWSVRRLARIFTDYLIY